MTKRELKHRIGKLEKALKQTATQAMLLREENKKLAEANAKLKKGVLKTDYKNRRLKARLEQTQQQVEAVSELNVMIRSEVWAMYQATQHRGGKAALEMAKIEAVMPGGGHAPLVPEDDPEQSRRKPKRYGLEGNGNGAQPLHNRRVE
jgi:regulator of replication initiation timing